MAFVRIPGGVWVPNLPPAWGTIAAVTSTTENLLVDADEEEIQFFGDVYLAAGSGSKTFGTSGSKVGWLPGTPITFAANSTLRVGVKKASTIDATSGPPARATIGAAAFDVYDDLVGGSDTITASTWREDAMSGGTPFTVTHGDRLAVCFHLDTTSGSPVVRIRTHNTAQISIPTATLITSGPTYNSGSVSPIVVLTFDDGSLGWLEGTFVQSALSSETIGDTNLYGNIVRMPFACKVDAIACTILSAGSTDMDFGFYSSPLGTPSAVAGGTVSIDPNLTGTARWMMRPLAEEITLAPATDYALAVKQNSATAIAAIWYSVDSASHLQANGLDSTCYAAKSTAGGAFASQNSGKRRFGGWFRISQIDTGKPGFIGG